MLQRQLDAVSMAAHLNGSPGYNALPATRNHHHYCNSTPRPSQKHYYSSQPAPSHRQREYTTSRPPREPTHVVPPPHKSRGTQTFHDSHITDPKPAFPSRPDRLPSSGPPPPHQRPHRTTTLPPPPPPPLTLPQPAKPPRPRPKRPVEIHNDNNNNNGSFRRSDRQRRRTSDAELLEFERRARRAQSGTPKRVRFSI